MMERPDLTTIGDEELDTVRVIFSTFLETFTNEELKIENKKDYIRDIEDELDAIDIEILARGGGM